LTQRGRDGCRVPLPWSGSSPPYGFSTAAPSDCWFPQPENWAGLTAQAQQDDPDSTLTLHGTALRIRLDHPAGGDKPLRLLSPPGASHLAFDRGAGMRCVVNFGPSALRLPQDAKTLPAGGPTVGGELPADTAVWLSMP